MTIFHVKGKNVNGHVQQWMNLFAAYHNKEITP